MENNLSFREGGEESRIALSDLSLPSAGAGHYTRGVNVDGPIFGEGGFWSSVSTNQRRNISVKQDIIHPPECRRINHFSRVYSWKENLVFDRYFSSYKIIIITRHAN